MSELRRDDLEACRALLAAGSKSFHLTSKLLPMRVRVPATVLYAFCRIADDAVDDVPSDARAGAGTPSATLATVAALRARLDRIYAQTPDDDPVDRALAAIVARSALPRTLIDALLEGLAWDAEGRRYETLDEVQAYAARVAGAIGVAMTILMGRRDPEVLARASDLGIAMQLTNIARDVGEDAGRGRIYLPLAWVREAGLDPEEWLARPTPSLGPLVHRLLAEAEVLYQRADAGIAQLPRDCRLAIRAASLVYAEIGRTIARERVDPLTRRAVVPTWRKLWLVARATTSWFWRPRACAAPAVASARFLLTAGPS